MLISMAILCVIIAILWLNIRKIWETLHVVVETMYQLTNLAEQQKKLNELNQQIHGNLFTRIESIQEMVHKMENDNEKNRRKETQETVHRDLPPCAEQYLASDKESVCEE